MRCSSDQMVRRYARPGRGGNAEHLLQALAVALGVDHGADAADPLHDLDHLVEVADLGQFLQPPVDIAHGRQSLLHDLVLEHEF